MWNGGFVGEGCNIKHLKRTPRDFFPWRLLYRIIDIVIRGNTVLVLLDLSMEMVQNRDRELDYLLSYTYQTISPRTRVTLVFLTL